MLEHLKTRDAFEQFRDTPEAIAYLLYVVLKIVICVNYYCRCFSRNHVTCKQIEFENVKRMDCPTCCNKCCWPLSKWIWYNIWRIPTKLCHLLVGIFFGAPLGVVERSPTEYSEQETDEQLQCEQGTLRTCQQEKDEQAQRKQTQNLNAKLSNCFKNIQEDENAKLLPKDTPVKEKIAGVPVFYIRGKRLDHRDVNVLAIIAIPFILLIATTFWDRFWFNETYSCIDNIGSVSCFPQATGNYTDKDFNITRHDPKIDDCQKWNDSVTFICFKLELNLGDALVDVGGLLTAFNVVTRMGATIIISVAGIICNNRQNSDNQGPCLHIKRCCSSIRQFFLGTSQATENQPEEHTGDQPEEHTGNQPEEHTATPPGQRDRCTRRPTKKCIRQVFAILLTLCEILCAFLIAFVYVGHYLSTGPLTDHSSILFQIYKKSNILLLGIGIPSTTLFLPLEEYVDESKNILNPANKRDYNTFELQSNV